MNNCKGTFWRYTVSSYMDKNGQLVRTERIRLLKSISCNNGCQPQRYPCQQDWIFEFLPEDISNLGDLPDLPKKTNNGDILELKHYASEDDCEVWFEIAAFNKGWRTDLKGLTND